MESAPIKNPGHASVCPIKACFFNKKYIVSMVTRTSQIEDNVFLIESLV